MVRTPCHYRVSLALLLMVSPTAATAQVNVFTSAQRLEGEADIQKAAAQLASSLKDPESATFRNVFIQKRVSKKHGEHVMVCGEVNARNSYGGLTGFHKFMQSGDSLYVGGGGGIDADFLCVNNNPIIDLRDYAVEMRAAYARALGK